MYKVFISLKNAYLGLIYCFKTQRNMVIHTVVGTIVLVSGFMLKVSRVEMLFLLTAVTLVIVAEALNTSLEKAIDLYTSDRSELAKISKDVAAGAVLLTAIFAVIVGLMVFARPLGELLKVYL